MRADEQQLQAWMISGLGGSAADHACLLRALVPLLTAFYRRRLAGRDEIEDLVQETLIAVHSRRATYDRERPFTAWLYAIARYKMIDHFRRHRRDVPLADVEDMLVSDGFEASSNARMDIDGLLATLSPKQAGMIRATQLEGHSVAEAATAAGFGQSDVKVSVHRGIKALTARIRGGMA